MPTHVKINMKELLLNRRIDGSGITLILSFQKPEVLGNKVEMQLTKLVEENPTILRFGIACEFPDARVRIHEKIQENNDECEYFIIQPIYSYTIYENFVSFLSATFYFKNTY